MNIDDNEKIEVEEEEKLVVKEDPAKEEEGDDDEREALKNDERQREERRKERHERKERQKQAMAQQKAYTVGLERKLVEQQERLAALETRQVNDGFSKLDRAIANAGGVVEQAKAEMAQAIKEGDGDKAAQAQDRMTEAKIDLGKMVDHRDRVVQAAQAPENPVAPPQQRADPAVVNNFKIFLTRNPWYKADGSSEDSRLVQQIDASVAADGYDPRSKDYWEELEDRVAQRGLAPKKNGSGPPPADTRGGNPPRTREVTLSKERVDALKEMGLWDDPKARQRMIRRYEEFDKQNRKV